jgi:hypothetical protein
MNKPFYFLFIGLLLAFAQSNRMANNVTVSNIRLTRGNTTEDCVMVQSDLVWENSWRTSSAPNNSLDALQQACAAGFDEFLALPLSKEQISAVLGKSHEKQEIT